jgi:hypothetical protein
MKRRNLETPAVLQDRGLGAGKILSSGYLSRLFVL